MPSASVFGEQLLQIFEPGAGEGDRLMVAGSGWLGANSTATVRQDR
jgi:hypothetical protein